VVAIPWLSEDEIGFPALDEALTEPDGLLAAGGDLSTARLIEAYRRGIFPWYGAEEPILWWSPNPRCVFYPDQFHVSRSLRRQLQRGDFSIAYDTAFAQVMHECAAPRGDNNGTWITPEMSSAYYRLHRQGVAHSIEVWRDGQLIGGLYGLAIGRIFYGESMFSRATGGSKIALAHLTTRLSRLGYTLLDCQVRNPHLMSLGALCIDRAEFRRILNRDASPEIKDHWETAV